MSLTPKRPIEIAGRVNRLLERLMPLLTPLGVTAGVLLPRVFLGLRPFVPWLFAAITLSGALKLRARELGKAVSSPLSLVFFFFTARFLMPLLAFLVSGMIFRNEPDTVSGYVLLYAVPTAVTGFIWSSIFGGDPALSLTLILLDTILAPFVVPGTVRLLLHTSVKLDMTGMTVSLIYMIVIPTIAGIVLNEASRGKFPAIVSPWLTPFSKICVLLMVAANSAAVAPQIRPGNPRLWIIIAVCISLSIAGFICGKLTGLAGRLEKEKQVSLFFASGLRNTSAAMTLGIEFFPPQAALPSVLGIIFQQSIAAIMGRLLLRKRESGGNPKTGDDI